MRIEFVCGCGLANYNLQDWICHFRDRGFIRGMRNLLMTKIKIRG